MKTGHYIEIAGFILTVATIVFEGGALKQTIIDQGTELQKVTAQQADLSRRVMRLEVGYAVQRTLIRRQHGVNVFPEHLDVAQSNLKTVALKAPPTGGGAGAP